MVCLGLAVLPKDDEIYYCPDCKKKENNNNGLPFEDIFIDN
jgi:hypothetical protein